jgi:hypothetical protein
LAEAISPLTGSCSLSLAIGLVSTGLLPWCSASSNFAEGSRTFRLDFGKSLANR